MIKKDTSTTTILILSMGFLVIYLIFSWKWSIYASLGLGLIGILSKTLSIKIEWAWYRLSYILSLIIPPILLCVVYYFILFPISLFYKIFNDDPLMLSNKHKSYFIDIDNKFSQKSMEHPW